MAKTPESYRLSRFNAVKYGTSVVGPIPCRGVACRYRWCDRADMTLPPPGDPCPFEVAYLQLHRRSFVATYRRAPIAASNGELEALAQQDAILALQRMRVSFRSNRAWDLADPDALTKDAIHEMDLCDRYFTSLLNGNAKHLLALDPPAME
jgi:hypothetical protein